MIFSVVGARPNFIKMAPIILEIKRRRLKQLFVHTGQHYDKQMSDVFLKDLGLPKPDVYLGVGSGSHSEQTAKIMMVFEKVCVKYSPRLVVVSGDVNSTLACALTAAKLNIPVAHVEAGLRSFDRTMPEEINRVLTDHVSELLFTTEPSGRINLLKEGISPHKTHFVGNSMIDSLKECLVKALAQKPWQSYRLRPGNYGVVTLHRPSNVDNPKVARRIALALKEIARGIPFIFPVHPRTLSRSNGLWASLPGVTVVKPLGYLEFLGLMAKAKVVITDSGGVQEETTALKIPCVTVRYNTERPITIEKGTNYLAGSDSAEIVKGVKRALVKRGSIPKLWDGNAAIRIVRVIEKWFKKEENEPKSYDPERMSSVFGSWKG